MKKLCWLAIAAAITCCGPKRQVRTFKYPVSIQTPARDEVTVPPPAEPEQPSNANLLPGGVDERLPALPDPAVRIAAVNAALEDAYFAYDRSDLTPEALASLRRDADLLCGILAEFPGLKIIVEGHCDERGSAEYNLALGERRARRAEEVLRAYRVPAEAIQVVSYGKEAPQCTEATDACRQKNRRAHMAVKK